MTRHKHAQTGLVTPSLSQHWLTAMLRAFAMLVLNVASTLQMIRRRDPVIGTQATPTDLPRAKIDTQSKETLAVQQDSLNSAHAEQRSYAARPSKHERVLTTLSPSFLRSRVSDGAEGAIWSNGPNREANAEGPRGSEGNACRSWLPALRFAPTGMTIIDASHQFGSVLLKQLASNKNAPA